VRRRACGVHTYADYRALLDRSPNEYERLRDALTINVTRFYRNAETWNLLRRDVLPGILDSRRTEVKVWSAGCASGEEPYTLALLVADHLDRAGRGDGLARLRIDATDIDRASLDRARAACYRSEGLTEMPDDLARPYFEAAGTERRVVDRVRRRVHVRHLDLSREPPLRTDYDLILCRNVLIYFNSALTAQVHRLLYGSLAPSGFLGLGGRESIKFTPHESCYEELDAREKVYRRVT